MNMAEKAKKLTSMTFLYLIALRNKTVAHDFFPSFHNTNGRLCHERLLKGTSTLTTEQV